MSSGESLINLIHREVLRVLHRVTRRTAGIVDSFDPKTHAVKLKLMPDSIDGDPPVITGWIPLHPIQTGNKAGWHFPPNIGDHGWLEFSEFDREGANFTVANFNDKFPPDDTVKAGEGKYIHPKTKSRFYFKDDGSVEIYGKDGTDGNAGHIIWTNDGEVQVISKSGSKVIVVKNGDVQIIPKSGNIVYVGGTGADGSYDWIVTNSGNSINSKARYA